MTSAIEILEREFAARYGFAGAVAAGFGRAALRLALEAIGVRGGDVLVPDFVCAQVPEAVRLAGGTPVYFPVSRGLDVAADAFRAAITAATRAAIAVHYFGRPLPSMESLAEVCAERRIALIEDCALALDCDGVGRHGTASVFSFTKSDWCYGGGLLASRDAEVIARAKAFRGKFFRAAPGLARKYGMLRRADFVSNRPSRARVAEAAGRRLERLFGYHTHGFYDAGRFDARTQQFAARRARRLTQTLEAAIRGRRAIVHAIRSALGATGQLFFQQDDGAQDSCAFLLINASGHAHEWRERAAREEVTLRLAWPAYQDGEPAQNSPDVRWLAENLLILEIHPDLMENETQRIIETLKKLQG